mmetsp:Transcript_5279/g.8712  ORF Transcript_5279/g.8712 Transcript_5279/m.8712 type:complete len:258 (-) Transcript_5279:32-805(-)
MRSSGSGILRNAGSAALGKSGPESPSSRGSKKINMDRVPVIPVMGYFYFQIDNWSTQIIDQWPRCPVMRSAVSELYGNSWQLLVYPRGSLLENSPFVEVQLVNRTNREIHARYSVSVLDHDSQTYVHTWSDPDGVVLFKPYGDEDDNWGNHEYIELETLEAPPYMHNDSVRFKAEIVANIVDELGALTPTTKPMGDVKPGTSLEIAKSELKQLSTHMSEQKVRMIKEEERLQDTLVRNRVCTMKSSFSDTNPLNFVL